MQQKKGFEEIIIIMEEEEIFWQLEDFLHYYFYFLVFSIMMFLLPSPLRAALSTSRCPLHFSSYPFSSYFALLGSLMVEKMRRLRTSQPPTIDYRARPLLCGGDYGPFILGLMVNINLIR